MKLEQKGHITKKERQDKAQVKAILKEQASGQTVKLLKVTKEAGAEGFFSLLSDVLKTNEIDLISLDQFQLNLLAINMQRFAQCEKNINEQGLLVDGKKNPLIAASNIYLKNVQSLFNDLGLSRNARMKQLLNQIQTQKIEDPFKDLIN
ncbi:P27 family phage terminase small subunit [Pediococcus acidilactici]|uniref:P27 family phage terminase small subunit n=1 Tax=Pediococcus acidilactici TaxID=1254 RepID=UPI001BD6D323|nr:P27 family phage terminase small subunit [Pediococcus acidilactici]MBS9400089.1 P27 family phage terminase small subunit [Pediococcus acidilactici]